jgi:hypothetical protein
MPVEQHLREERAHECPMRMRGSSGWSARMMPLSCAGRDGSPQPTGAESTEPARITAVLLQAGAPVSAVIVGVDEESCGVRASATCA